MSSSPIIEKSPTNPPHPGETRNSPELKGPDSGTEHHEHLHAVEWSDLARIAFVGLGLTEKQFHRLGEIV